MPSRPSEYLNWVPGGSASYLVDPPSGQKTTGWISNQKPPFRYMNWLFNLIDQWIQYLDASALTVPWPQYNANSEATLSSAITSATGSGGGVIVLTGSFSISTGYTIPVGTILVGRGGSTVITVLSGGSITLSNGANVRDLWFTTSLTSGTIMTLSNNYSLVRNCQFTIPTNSTGQAINVTGNANKMYNCVFVGVEGSDSGYGINYSAGVGNADYDSVFLP